MVRGWRGPAWTEAGASLPGARCQGSMAKRPRLVSKGLGLEGLVLQWEHAPHPASRVSRGRVSTGWARDLSFEKRRWGRGGGPFAEGRPHACGFPGASRARRWPQMEGPVPPGLSV